MKREGNDRLNQKGKPDAVQSGHSVPVSREQELRESELKFRSLFNQATDAILLMKIIDNIPIIVDVNDATLKMHGYSKDELTGKPISFLDDPESAKRIPERVQELKKKGRARFEAVHVRKDGTTFPIEVNTQIIKIGEEPYILTIDRNITNRKKVENALKESEERYRNVFNNNHTVMLLFDPESGEIVDANPAALNYYGFDRAQIMGMKITDINIPSEGEVNNEITQEEKEKGKHFIFKQKLSDGQIRDVEIYSGPIRMHGRKLLFSVIHDITDRRKAEQALFDHKDFLSSIFESLTHPFFVINVDDYRITHMNSSARPENGDDNITCYKLSHGFDSPCNSEDHPCVIELVKKIKGPITVEHNHLDKQGRPITVEVHGYPVFDKKGDVSQVIEYNIDITDRKKAEQEKERLNKELEQIIYATSHDLRSPLVNIAGYSKELDYSLHDLASMLRGLDLPPEKMEIIKSIIDDDTAESMKYITSSIQKMDSLLKGLLQLSRSGSMGMFITDCDMNNIISDILNAMEYQLVSSGVKCEVSDLPSCRGDESQINQIFSNLIGNALKYMEPSRKGKIKITGRKKRSDSVYCIEDNGIGIAPDNADKIFELFQKISPENEGEGIGLTIVKKIVERHNGKIWVESALGAGSRFYVSLPGISTTSNK
jgi:PAS domain S-box-containing protein